MTETVVIDLDYRPVDYWAPEAWPKHVLANVKGALRKQQAQRLLEEGGEDHLFKYLLQADLGPELREALGRIHPWLMGGEYLPQTRTNEVEIARVTLRSVTMDVLSVRARKTADLIRYRAVDEYETKYKIRPASSVRPLSLNQLIQLMDSALPEGEDERSPARGLVYGALNGNLISYPDPMELRSFATVSSEFYPQLHSYYCAAIESYLRNVGQEGRAR
jgi:hypothetical protein